MAVRRRKVRAVRNPHGAGQVPTGEWLPAEGVKFNEDGTVTVARESNPRRRRGRVRNIFAGYYHEDDDGVYRFHPIRSSHDYSRSRAGESAKRKGKGKKGRARAKKRKR